MREGGGRGEEGRGEGGREGRGVKVVIVKIFTFRCSIHEIIIMQPLKITSYMKLYLPYWRV